MHKVLIADSDQYSSFVASLNTLPRHSEALRTVGCIEVCSLQTCHPAVLVLPNSPFLLLRMMQTRNQTHRKKKSKVNMRILFVCLYFLILELYCRK